MVRSNLPRPPEKIVPQRREVRRHARADPTASRPAGGKTVHLIRRTASGLYEKALEVRWPRTMPRLRSNVRVRSNLRAI